MDLCDGLLHEPGQFLPLAFRDPAAKWTPEFLGRDFLGQIHLRELALEAVNAAFLPSGFLFAHDGNHGGPDPLVLLQGGLAGGHLRFERGHSLSR